MVTGTGGLGFETALALARAGGEVIIAGRNPEKGAAAVRRILGEAPGASVSFEVLDLADLKSVAAFAERLQARSGAVDVLINNAGIMSPPVRQTTADGFEAQIGVNHLGHFALTGRLLPVLRRSAEPRVVSLTSNAHKVGWMDLDDLQGERRYRAGLGYVQSKLAVAMFARELQRRSDEAGWGLKSLAAHPGFASTDIFSNALGQRSLINRLSLGLITPMLGHSAAAGALSILYAATSPEAEGGALYGPRGLMEMRGAPGRCEYAPAARDARAASRLWAISEELTGVRMAGEG